MLGQGYLQGGLFRSRTQQSRKHQETSSQIQSFMFKDMEGALGDPNVFGLKGSKIWKLHISLSLVQLLVLSSGERIWCHWTLCNSTLIRPTSTRACIPLCTCEGAQKGLLWWELPIAFVIKHSLCAHSLPVCSPDRSYGREGISHSSISEVVYSADSLLIKAADTLLFLSTL